MTPYSESIERQRVSIWMLAMAFLKDLNNSKVAHELLLNSQTLHYPLLALCGCLYNHAIRSLNL